MSEEFNARRTIVWVGPFAVFMAWLAVDAWIPLGYPAREIARDVVLACALLGFSRSVIPRAAPRWLASVAIGLGVFLIWIAPDHLVHGWRSGVLFQNSVTGHLKLSIPAAELTPVMLALRTARAVLIVPVIEELFWRGWLARWLQDTAFEKVPIGVFTPFAFWGTALLFGAEHGPYWEVGLVCGVIYNWWLARTRSLGDVVIAHATTNLALSLYVIYSAQFVYWM